MKTLILVFLIILFQSNNLFSQSSSEDKEKFIKMAIELSKIAMEEGEYPFGAVVVKDGVVIGKGYNSSGSLNDPTAHGEIMAIRDACKNLNTNWLEDCELYTNGEPCPMCFSACFFSNIKTVYYSSSKEDMISYGIVDMVPYEQVCLPNDQRIIKMEAFKDEESGIIFAEWAKTKKKW